MKVGIAVATALLLLLKKKQLLRKRRQSAKKKTLVRRYGCRPLNRERFIKGFYKSYFLKMKSIDPEQFFKYCRMTSQQFDVLLEKVEPLLQKEKRALVGISVEQRLAITLQ